MLMTQFDNPKPSCRTEGESQLFYWGLLSQVAPHTHPDSREVTILSGTWYTGYGEKFDPAALKELPAGSFYTEPANVAHFVEVREPVLIQASGTGPSGRKFINPTDNPK